MLVKEYRIILVSEDGEHTLRDGYSSLDKANFVADKLKMEFGEGQTVFVESYNPRALWHGL